MAKRRVKKPRAGGPCPRCLDLAKQGKIRYETVMPLPEGAMAPLAQDGTGPCCYDCGSSDALTRFGAGMDFEMARIAVGNDRQIQFRIPADVRPRYGLAKNHLIRVLDLSLEQHHAWLSKEIPTWDEEPLPGERR